MNPSDPRKPVSTPMVRTRLRRPLSPARRAWMVIAAILALVVLVPVVAVMIINVRGERAWRAYAKEAEVRGVVLSIKQLVPPPVPDDENFAMAPVFAGLFSTNYDPDTSRFKLPDGFPKLTNHVTDFVALRDALVSNGVLAAAGTSPVADVRGVLAKYDEAVEALREAAKRPTCRWPVEWEKGFAALCPHASELVKTARLLRLRVRLSLAEGDARAALADLRLTHRLQASLERDPSLIAGLVRTAILRIEVAGIAEGLERRVWAEAELAAMEDLLRDVSAANAAVVALNGERATIADTIETLVHGGEEFSALTGSTSARAMRLYPTGWMRADAVLINQAFDDMATAVDARAGTFGPGISIEERLDALSTSFLRFKHLFAALLMPAIDRAMENFARTAAQVEFARVGIALERYRLKHGTFPEKLSDLGETRADFARNPDGGGVLSYRREADGGYLLWATGPLSGGTTVGPSDAGGRDAAEWRWRMPGPGKSG